MNRERPASPCRATSVSFRRVDTQFHFAFSFEAFDLALHNLSNENGSSIRAKQVVYTLRQSFRQANDGGFHSERRSSHNGVVTGHQMLSIRT